MGENLQPEPGPDRELSPCPVGLWDEAQPTDPPQPEPTPDFCFLLLTAPFSLSLPRDHAQQAAM